MDGFLFALTLITALGCGVSAGALFAFSSFVMQALAKLQPARGMEAMQSINLLAPTPAFMTALFGTAVACALLAIWGIFTLDESYGVYLLIGGALYLLGTIGLTIGYHVPRNNAVEPRASRRGRRSSGDVHHRANRCLVLAGLRETHTDITSRARVGPWANAVLR